MSNTVKKLTTSSDTSDLAAQIDTLRNDIAALAQTVGDIGKARGEEAVNAAKGKVDAVRDQAADAADTARLRAMEFQDQADNFIKTQPGTALGVAAGIGFLIGFFGSRR